MVIYRMGKQSGLLNHRGAVRLTSTSASPPPAIFVEGDKIKICSKCRKEKDGIEFYVDRSKKDELSSYCKECQRQRSKYRNVKEYRTQHLKRHYGITLQQYDEMFDLQNGVCAICQNFEYGCRLSVDHEHKTGKIRGLLCKSCNARLGVLEDEVFVHKVKQYLKGHQGGIDFPD